MTRARPTTACDRIIAALRTGPKVTGELADPAVGGVRFSARVMELRARGFVIEDVLVRQGQWRYRLVSEPGARPALTVVADGSWRLPPGPWFNVCDREPCGQRWKSDANPEGCPSCLASVAWISSFTVKYDADDHVPLFQRDRLVERQAA
jgi:hypothetical protein